MRWLVSYQLGCWTFVSITSLGEIALLPFNMPFGISIGTLAFTIVMCVFSGVLAVRRVLSADPAEVF